jgi:peptidoglycan hydrolase-like protein with peptidoglycan-binding domain
MCEEDEEMKRVTALALLLASVAAMAPPAFAQLPGETRPPRSYDPVGDMQHNAQRWAPNEKVREIQQALRDQGYYNGNLDGVLTPEFRRAIWDFQRAKGLPRTARLDDATIAALGLPATGAASPGSPSSFGAREPSRSLDDVQAP